MYDFLLVPNSDHMPISWRLVVIGTWNYFFFLLSLRQKFDTAHTHPYPGMILNQMVSIKKEIYRFNLFWDILLMENIQIKVKARNPAQQIWGGV